ncbi:RidA family protein [Novacetimonas maltaceti]|nr:RidA family protein [Novacetimonas maltaceti]
MLAQFRQALGRGSSLLQQHGHTLHDVTRIVCTVDGTREFASCFTTLSELFGPTCPALTFRLVRTHDTPDQLIELDLVVAPPASGLPTD